MCVVLAAVDASQFRPDLARKREGRLTVVMLSRLVYRKGIDLLAVIIPEMCHRYPHVDFLIGLSQHPAQGNTDCWAACAIDCVAGARAAILTLLLFELLDCRCQCMLFSFER